MSWVSKVATVVKTVDEVRVTIDFTMNEELPASHALGERGFTHNFRSKVIPAQAGTQALRPFSLGTRLRGYDGMSSSCLSYVVKHQFA